MDLITCGNARKLLKINGVPISTITFNKFVKKGLITVEQTIWGGWRLFDKDKIEEFAQHLPKKLKRGLPITFR
jgi:DNA-binding transcriptional MerR regulator